MKVGFIGLGSLQRAGHELQSFDLNGKGSRRSLREACEGAEVLFTSLPGPAEVESVAGEVSAPVWFDLSTNSPKRVRILNKTMSEKGVRVLDAPVSGGPKGAQSGKLALWVGGERTIYDKYLPVLRAIGDQPQYVGPIGAGTIAKLVHNCATFTVQAALAEVFTLGVKAGVDSVALFQAIRQGASGRRRTFDRLPDHFLIGDYDPPEFTTRLAHKDVSLAVELAHEVGVPMEIGEVALAELTEAMRRGWGERDCRVSMTLQEERAAVSVSVPAERLRAALAE